jgi:hypothetical protein
VWDFESERQSSNPSGSGSGELWTIDPDHEPIRVCICQSTSVCEVAWDTEGRTLRNDLDC